MKFPTVTCYCQAGELSVILLFRCKPAASRQSTGDTGWCFVRLAAGQAAAHRSCSGCGSGCLRGDLWRNQCCYSWSGSPGSTSSSGLVGSYPIRSAADSCKCCPSAGQRCRMAADFDMVRCGSRRFPLAQKRPGKAVRKRKQLIIHQAALQLSSRLQSVLSLKLFDL